MNLLALVISLTAPALSQAHPNFPAQLARIYSYQCEARFLEGEGVSPHQVSCVAGQRLGQIRANYTHYLGSSAYGDNFHQRGADESYGPVCNREMHRVICSKGNPQPAFGLSARQEGPFQVSIRLGANRHEQFLAGFAAPMGPDGSCPPGLVAAWIHRASPASVQYPLPSNFWNSNGGLDNWQVRGYGSELPAFTVKRLANTYPCDHNGDCSGAAFGPAEVIQEVPYSSTGIGACVVPVTALASRK